MKIKNIKNPKEYFERLKECKGNIELVTQDGDRLNLKSKLCQYIVMMDIFGDAEIGDIEVFFSQPEDLALVLDYLVRG